MAAFPPALETMVKDGITEMTSATAGMETYKISTADPSVQGEVTIAIASVIGFTGDKIKGSLVVSCDKDLLDKSHPNHVMGMPVNEPDLSDWSGEIANQILGRIKNKVAQAGTTFSMATPTTVVGKRMQISVPKDGSNMRVTMEGPHGQMQVYFIASLDPTLVLDGANATDAAKEGEAILF